MKDFLIETLKDSSFGESLNMREKFELLLHSGARKRNVDRAKSAVDIGIRILNRGKELHNRKIESMLD